MRRVVITGMGTINPVGHDLEETWTGIQNGVCGIDFIKQIDTSQYKVKIAAEVKDYEADKYLDRKEARRMDRYTQFAMIAFREAFKDAGISIENEDPYRCGTIISSGIGGLKTIENEYIKGQSRGFEKISPYFIPMSIANMAAGEIAIEAGFKGVCESIVTACASGSNAVGEAFHYIRDNYADVMLCGGSEGCICDLGLGGFTVMKALNTGNDPKRASIPFDAERGGFVMGEGAGILVIEELEHAKARGAKIYAEIVGYGATCDAHHITAPDPTGMGAANCMSKAVKDAEKAVEAAKEAVANQFATAHNTLELVANKGFAVISYLCGLKKGVKPFSYIKKVTVRAGGNLSQIYAYISGGGSGYVCEMGTVEVKSGDVKNYEIYAYCGCASGMHAGRKM